MIINELKELVGKKLILYTSNKFRYEIKLIAVGDDGFIKVVDLRHLNTRFFKISEINEFEEVSK